MPQVEDEHRRSLHATATAKLVKHSNMQDKNAWLGTETHTYESL